jgi:hypothetical protein
MSGGGSFGTSSSKQKSQSSSAPLNPDQVAGYFKKLDDQTGGSDIYGSVEVPVYGKKARLIGTRTEQRVIGRNPGRLEQFAQQGTPSVDYQAVDPAGYFDTDVTYRPVSDEQLRNLGGAGATRELSARRARQQAIEELTADPSLTTFQRQRTRQLTDRDYSDALDAIGKETEAALTSAALEQALREQAGRAATADQKQRQAAFLQTERGRQYDAAVRNADLTREDLLALAEIFFGGKGQVSQSTSKGKSSSLNFSGYGGVGAG